MTHHRSIRPPQNEVSVNEAIEERIVQPAARRLTAIARNTKCEARIAEAACYVFLEGLA